MIEFSVTIIVLVSVWLMCASLSRPKSKLYVLDQPTDRSLHSVPKPRVGGIAIFSAIFISFSAIFYITKIELLVLWLLIGMFLLALISFFDDRNSIPQFIRFVTHIIAAVVLISGGLSAQEMGLNVLGNGYMFNFILVVVIVWVINLYNFMDGVDGLAGGMAAIGFLTLGILAWKSDEHIYMLMAWIVAAANCGFLIHNFPPAKIFMGDLGSITNGYLVAFFSLWGVKDNVLHWWGPILIFSPFIVDTTITLIKRIMNREKIWQAHKSHYYQRLVDSGWSHTKTVLFEYILMSLVALTTIVLHIERSQKLLIIALCSWVIIYFLIIISITHFYNFKDNQN